MDKAAEVSGDAEKNGIAKEGKKEQPQKQEQPQKRRLNLDSFKREMLEGASMHMSRVPPAAKKRFKELSEREFNDDYGMTLMYLLDRYEDFKLFVRLLDGQVELHKRMNQIECFLYDITHPTGEETTKVKTTMGGKVLVPIKREGGK